MAVPDGVGNFPFADSGSISSVESIVSILRGLRAPDALVTFSNWTLVWPVDCSVESGNSDLSSATLPDVLVVSFSDACATYLLGSSTGEVESIFAFDWRIRRLLGISAIGPEKKFLADSNVSTT